MVIYQHRQSETQQIKCKAWTEVNNWSSQHELNHILLPLIFQLLLSMRSRDQDVFRSSKPPSPLNGFSHSPPSPGEPSFSAQKSRNVNSPSSGTSSGMWQLQDSSQSRSLGNRSRKFHLIRTFCNRGIQDSPTRHADLTPPNFFPRGCIFLSDIYGEHLRRFSHPTNKLTHLARSKIMFSPAFLPVVY